MKRAYTPILVTAYLLIASCLTGQVTITNSVFPVPGDTLMVVELGPNAPLTRGELQLDDQEFVLELDDLPFGVETSTVFRAAADGMNASAFPQAELVSTTLGGAPGEVYYDVYNNRIDELGRGNQNFGFGPIDIPFEYSDVPTYARAPISFNDVFEDNSEGSVSVSRDFLPDSLLASIPPAIGSFDSIRVSLETSSQVTVDGYGSVILPSGEYDVLREAVETTTTTKLFINTSGNWVEVGSILLNLLGELGQFFGERTTTAYNFLSPSAKEPILAVSFDESDQLISAAYKSGRMVSSNNNILAPSTASISAYPNPTLGDITFDLGGYGPGSYTISVYNIVGSEVASWDVVLNSDTKYSTSVSELRKGTYIYKVTNGDGLTLATKRFIVLKP